MKKLFTLLTMLLVGIGSMWGDNNPVVVTFGNDEGIEGLTTDAFNLGNSINPSGELSDGTTYAFTTNKANVKYWAGGDGNIEGSWTNSVAIADINTVLGTTAFDAAYFSANSSLKYLATGGGGSYSTLTLTFNNKQEGDRITLYASLARRNGSLSNFSASGLEGKKIQYAVFGGSGFSDTQAFSQRTGSSTASPVTIVKITGTLGSDKQITMSSTSDKNGWQMIAYKFDYPHVTGSVTNNDKNLGTIHVTRGLSLSGEDKTLDIVTQTGTNPHSVYQNATNQTFTICAGQDIKVSYNQVDGMHAYMYIDYNNDGQFSPYTIQESGIPTEDSELVSYTYYNGKNSKGESASDSDSGSSLPVFTIPSDLAQGTYRARYKLDRNFLDPYGSDASNRTDNYTIDNRGVIIDFIIQVGPKYTVTSNTKLSEISNYDSYKTIYVNENVTLTVDVDDFDLAYISGAGNIILDANAPLSDITVSGSLTVNSGKTLTVTAENFDLTRITGEGNVVVSEKWTSSILTSPLNITYIGGAGTSESRVSINHNGGSATLTGADKTYYLTGSSSATQTTINFDGTTVNYNNELGIGAATYNINNTQITTPRFITSQGEKNRPAVVNLTGNTKITVSGYSDDEKNADSNKSAIMIGHWPGTSNLTLSGTAQIEATDAQLLIGKSGYNQTITLNGSSNITAKGIKVSSNASGTNTLNLNGGSLNLGDVGITSYSSSRSIAVNVNENTTITATASTLPLSQPITIASGKTLTINGGESKATVTLTGTLNNNGTVILEDAGIGGSARITTSNTVNIKNLAGNNISGNNGYAFVGSGSLNFYGTCDLTKQSDGTTANDNCKMGYGNSNYINVKEGANVTTGAIFNTTTSNDNAYIIVESGATLNAQGEMRSISATNNGTMSGTALYGPLTLGDGSITTLSDATPFHNNSSTIGSVTVNGDATLNLTATTATLTKAITVASGKTLTIDGGSNTVSVTGTVTNNGTINFENATLTANLNDRTLANYTFTNCTATLQFVETGAEYAAGGFTITNIPSGVTVKVKKYDATTYEAVTIVDGTATFSHDDVGVSGYAAWLDYTFDETTLPTNKPATPINNVPNRGNAGSGQTLTIDNSQTSAVSYNSDGTFKVRYTPYRDMTWPENYTVAVSGNFPDVENGCLVAFGTKSVNYLALIRGANSNEIKLVKGKGDNTYTNIQTMAAENATAAAHLVVFTKQGNVFKVYCDGVNVATTEYDQTLGGGLQVGSIHGGYANTGVVSVMDNSLTDDQKNAVFCNAIRVYNYIISDAQMEDLKTEFPYVSKGGNYTRSISADAYLEAESAWYNVGEKTYTDLPTNNVEEQVTYYPDIVITTTAASTLTVNANMDSRNIEFNGAGKLTIASDGTHNISIKGSVTANGPVSIKYGETDLSRVPVSIGESGSVEFDFSASDFRGVTTSTDYPITGNTSDYGNKVTGVYPNDEYHTFTITYKSTTNSYYLTVGPSVALKRQQAIDFVTPYNDGGYVGTGLGKYTISLGETSYSNYADFETAVMNWQTLEDCVEPTIAINMPANGFYRFTSQNNLRHKENVDKYIHNYLTGDAITDGLALNTTKDETTIFYVDCENNRILSYADGKYLYYWNRAPTVGNSGTWTIMEGSEIGKYAIEVSGSETWYVSDWGDTTDRITYGLKDANALWALETVESLPLTLAANSYTSFSAPVAVTIPANCHAYIAIKQNGNLIKMKEVSGNVPANTGLIIGTDASSNPTFDIYDGSEFAGCTGNMLVANVAASALSRSDNYFFGKQRSTGNYIFTMLSGDGDNYTLYGHKAYLPKENLASVEGARISIIWGDDDSTGLEELNDKNIELKDGKYYQDDNVVVVRNGVKYNVAGQVIK